MTAALFETAPPSANTLPDAERNALVVSCQKLCRKLANDAARSAPAHDVEDLEQEALLACVEASRRWSPDAGTKFSTYATACINRHLANVTTRYRGEGVVGVENWDVIEQPENDAEAFEPVALEGAHAEAVARLGEPARTVVALIVVERLTPDQVAVRLDMPLKDVKLVMRNAAKALPRELARAASPGLFGDD